VTEGQPGSPGSREARQISGEARSREAQQRNGPHQGRLAASELETNAERLRRAIANSGGLSDYLAQRERMAADIRAQVKARAATRREEAGLSCPQLERYASQRPPGRPEWAQAGASELSPQQEQALREELRNQWENRQRTGLVSRPPLKAVPKSQRSGVKDETLVRDVIERDPGAAPPHRTSPRRQGKRNLRGRGEEDKA
jgi:hypothetical protein